MASKLRSAAEAIHERVGADVGKTFGRRAAGKHTHGLHIKYIPIGGPIEEAKQSAGKSVAGPAGMIIPSPNATLKQPGVDTRQSACATREPRLLALCIAGARHGKTLTEEEGIDAAEALLERLIVAAHLTFGADVSFEQERWVVQEEEAASYGVAGEAIALTMAFQFPVIHDVKPVVKLTLGAHACKLNDTMAD